VSGGVPLRPVSYTCSDTWPRIRGFNTFRTNSGRISTRGMAEWSMAVVLKTTPIGILPAVNGDRAAAGTGNGALDPRSFR